MLMPMIPDLASVMRKRYRMQRNIRFIALILLIIGVVYSGFGVVGAVGRFTSGWGALSAIESLFWSAPFLATGALLGGLSSRITRWVLPLPKAGCPRCGYRLVALVEPRCPECGLGLPRELMHDSDNAR